MNKEITTLKMPGETEQQYMAWVLYCEAGSISKLRFGWKIMQENVGETSGILGDPNSMFRKLPTVRNLERWSSKYHWVERKKLMEQQEAEKLNEKLGMIIQKRKYEVVIAFGYAVDAMLKQLKDPNHYVTVSDLKTIWEMANVELEGMDFDDPPELKKSRLKEEIDDILECEKESKH